MGDVSIHREVTPLGAMLVRSMGDQRIETQNVNFPREGNEGIATFWEGLVPVLRSTAEDHTEMTGGRNVVRFSARGINFNAALIVGVERVGLEGFFHPRDSWIWVQGADVTGPLPNRQLIRLGSDQNGVYWEYEGKRRSSKEDLARLILGPLASHA